MFLPLGVQPALMGSKVHLSLSNLPLMEWHEGITMCHRKGMLYRTTREGVLLASICKQCMKEAVL